MTELGYVWHAELIQSPPETPLPQISLLQMVDKTCTVTDAKTVNQSRNASNRLLKPEAEQNIVACLPTNSYVSLNVRAIQQKVVMSRHQTTNGVAQKRGSFFQISESQRLVIVKGQRDIKVKICRKDANPCTCLFELRPQILQIEFCDYFLFCH